MDLGKLFGRQATSEKRSLVIGGVKNVLGFFALALLIIEATLVVLVASATGDQRTILIYGMLAIFAALIIIFAVLVSLNPGLFLPVGSPSAKLNEMAGAPPRPASNDFITGFFKNDAEFFDQIRKVGTRTAETAQNLKAEKLTVIHYIRNDFQIGFRAYQGLLPSKHEREGTLPLVVVTDRGGRAPAVDYFEWDDDHSSPTIGTRTATANATPSVVVTGKGPRNLSIFQFYKDSNRPGDWFLVNPFSFGSTAVLEHYVLVRNEDLCKWNPNKFVFEVRQDGIIGFSSAVYTALLHQEYDASPKLADARRILSKFSDIAASASASTNFNNVRKQVGEIFENGSFNPDVTVFSLQRTADDTNLVLAYVFPE